MAYKLTDIGRRTSIDFTAGTFIRQILGRLLIDLSWASSRLEGNTYSLLETERLIAFGESAPGKTPFETQMVLNHKAAIEFLVDAADEMGFDRQTILNLHALLSDNLLGVYELNRIELLKDVFVWTYERSCQRYHVVRHALGEPDAFRLRYRKDLIDCVGEAIRQVGQGKVTNEGEVFSPLVEDRVAEDDREHFLKIAKEEIAALHEGNFARYRLRPGEFLAWQKRKT